MRPDSNGSRTFAERPTNYTEGILADNSNWPCEMKTVIDVRKGDRVIASLGLLANFLQRVLYD